MLIILLGPPAAGKGTQAKFISKFLGVPHISTGDIFRQNIKQKTVLGVLADKFIQKGNLVPDDVTVALVKERLQMPDCESGCLLDGFPRTLPQATELDGFAKVDVTLNIEVLPQVLIGRVVGRRVCGKCGKSYHISVYSDDKCACGEELFTREDDTEEVFVTRLSNYERQTKPLRDYYQRQGKLVDIAGEGSPEEVFERVKDALVK